MNYELGTTIIDELKICYIAEFAIIEELKTVDYGCTIDFPDFTFYRTISHHFKYAYDICIKSASGWQKIATACFGRYGDMVDKQYFFFRVENRVLYDANLFEFTMSIPVQLGLMFNNFTSIDLAIDFKTDIAKLMKRMWHRKDITTIINGKAIKNRTATITNLKLIYNTSLDRLKSLTVYVKQAKAANNKTKGVTVQAYNKTNEITLSSNKDYINHFYGNPKRLYRLEVHLNNAEIQDYCKSLNTYQNENIIYDKDFLTNMFYYHLSSVIRFTKGRKKLDWRDIIKSNGKI